MARFFLFIYDLFEKRKGLLFGITLAVFVASLFFASKIRFEEDITQFIPDDGEMKTSNAVFRNIKVRDRLTVHLYLTGDTVSSRPDLLVAYCDSLSDRLSPLVPDYVREIMTRAPDGAPEEVYDLTYDHLPVFLQEKDYEVIAGMLSREAVAERLQNNRNTLMSPTGFAMRKFIADDPLGINLLALKHLQQLSPADNFDLYRGYFFTSDRRHLLLFLVPSNSGTETADNARIVDDLDKEIADLQTAFPEVTAEYFGGPAVSVCNARQIKRDTMITLNIALLIIILFVVILFRSKRAPLLMLLPVVFGAGIALMMLYFIKCTVSSITVVAGSVVVGIALNYSIHVLSHLRHAASPREVTAGLASPLTLGSFTTVGAFLGLTFAKSRALADFGLFAAFCLAASALFCLIVLPHLLPSGQRKEKNDSTGNFVIDRFRIGGSKLFERIERIASFRPERRLVVPITMIVITVFCLFFTGRTSFDSDMMHLNYMDDKLQKAEQNLSAITSDVSGQTVFLVSTGNDLQEAEKHHQRSMKLVRQLQTEGIVKDYASPEVLLIPESEQAERIARWNRFWTEEKKTALRHNLYEEGAKHKFNEKAFDPFLDLLDREYAPVDVAAEDAGKVLLSEMLTQTDGLSMILSRIRVPDGQKEKAYERLEEADHLVILDRSYFTRKFLHIISDDFYLILFISSFIVFFALWITYGRIELALMTFTPMALGWIWITGIMGAFDMSFNIVNIIISTFIFGLGDDYSIFITDGLTDEYRSAEKTLPVHKTAIFLSAFAMIVGMGVLIFARHPALKSIATVSVVGMLAVVAVAYTVQPFLFRRLISGRTSHGKYPYTLESLLSSVWVFIYFGTGSILLSLLSLVLKIVPLPIKAKRYFLHWLMSKLAKSTLYCYPLAEKRLPRREQIRLDRPAVIVANHQSFLDILCILSLQPKIVMLVADWVWNSPFFGLLVRNTGFYHVKDGYEKSAEALSPLIADGYSVAVFPEGSRSADNKIRRFRNGAFFLARRLKLDILPVVLHGTGQVMPKNDPFRIRKGRLTVEVLPRIDYRELRQNDDRENARHTAELIRYRYTEAESRNNVPDNPYFRQRLITNFIYKGPVVEWYLRIKLRMERNYAAFDRMIPREATITDLGCGYGFLTYMLAFLSEKRTVTGIDYDEDKIQTADHCFSKNEQIRFEAADVTDCRFPRSDVFILSDMLHYLVPEKQRSVLSKCVERLNPGGMIIIRDADRNKGKAHRLTRLTEFFSTRLFRFNKTANELYFLSESDVREFADRYGFRFESVNNDKYTSNVIYCLQDVRASAKP